MRLSFLRAVLLQFVLGRRDEQERQRNVEAPSCNHCCRGKAINIIYFCVYVYVRASARVCTWVSACVIVWVWVYGADVCLRAYSLTYPACNAHAPHFLRPLAPPYFSISSYKRHDFLKKVTECEMWFDFLYDFYLRHFLF